MNGDERPDTSVVVRSVRYVMLQDDDGISIWRLAGEDEAAIAEFPPTDEGYDEAFAFWDDLAAGERRGKLLTWIARIAAALAALWLLLILAVVGTGAVLIIAGPRDVDPNYTHIFSVVVPQYAMVFSTGFFVAVGIYVVLWMHLWRKDP